jgi:hypothetical protein
VVFVTRLYTAVYRFRIPAIYGYRVADFNRFDSLSVGFFADFDIGAVIHGCSLLLLRNGLQLNGWLVVQQPLFRWFNVQQPLYHTVKGLSERVG